MTETEIEKKARAYVTNRFIDAESLIKEVWPDVDLKQDPALVIAVAQIFATEYQTVVLRHDLGEAINRLNQIGKGLEFK